MLLLVYTDQFFVYIWLDSLSESEVSFALDSYCICADSDYFHYCFCNASQICLLLCFDEGMLYLNRLLTSWGLGRYTSLVNLFSPMEMLIYTSSLVFLRVDAGIVMIFGVLSGIDVSILTGILLFLLSQIRVSYLNSADYCCSAIVGFFLLLIFLLFSIDTPIDTLDTQI